MDFRVGLSALLGTVAVLAMGLSASNAFALPADRGYELVSPGAEKLGADATFDPNPLWLFAPVAATPSGQPEVGGLAWPSRGSFLEVQGDVGNPVPHPYVSRRTPDGWTTTNRTMPQGPFCGAYNGIGSIIACTQINGPRTTFFSADLTRTVQASSTKVFGAPRHPGDPSDPRYNFNLYLQTDTVDGFDYELLTESPVVASSTNSYLSSGIMAGKADDLSHFVFITNRSVIGGEPCDASLDPCAGPNSGGVYEYVDGDIRLVSILPDNEGGGPVAGNIGQIGGAFFPPFVGSITDKVEGAVSDDGGRITFGSPAYGASRKLYQRQDGERTVRLSRLEPGCGSCVEGGDSYWAASRDGTAVVFSSTGRLTSDAEAGTNLYRWIDDGSAMGEVDLLTHGPAGDAGFKGVAAVDERADTVYFVSDQPLTAAAGTGTADRLYAWRSGGANPRYVATLLSVGGGDSAYSNLGPSTRSQASPDGRYLLFRNTANLTPDSQDYSVQALKLYLYDFVEDEIRCLTCAGEPPEIVPRPMRVTLDPRWDQPNAGTGRHGITTTRNLVVTEEGVVQVAFTTEQALLPDADINGVEDAYLWQDGELYLLSSGSHPESSFMMEMSADGRDIFILTREQLTGWDVDEQYDYYTARVGGGFPEPVEPTTCGSIAQCRATGSLVPETQWVVSGAVQPAQEVAEARIAVQGLRARLRRGRSVVVGVRAVNRGKGTAAGVRVCARLGRTIGCRKIGRMPGGSSARQVVRLRLPARLRGVNLRRRAVVAAVVTTNANRATGRTRARGRSQ